MKCVTMFRQGSHRWLAVTGDPGSGGKAVDTNQFVVAAGNSGMLLDPGGIEVFPAALSALTQEIDIDDIHYILLSHQDPDVGSALPLWRRVCRPDVTLLVSSLWTGFYAHVDAAAEITPIPDEGTRVKLGEDVTLQLVPAHYLHSAGNFHVYDPEARILFSGDVGAALLPKQALDTFYVTDFAHHIPYMEGFHRRWMGSPAARDAWVSLVSRLDVKVMAPQHGLAMRGDDVKRFLDWFAKLELGSGVAAMRAER
ncbi:MAG: MBL fold metallo-hydrolase [Rhodospirillales bacterium]|nr:MBL fold metallo-hydrolase [Rhodospirillales bacterium]